MRRPLLALLLTLGFSASVLRGAGPCLMGGVGEAQTGVPHHGVTAEQATEPAHHAAAHDLASHSAAPPSEHPASPPAPASDDDAPARSSAPNGESHQDLGCEGLAGCVVGALPVTREEASSSVAEPAEVERVESSARSAPVQSLEPPPPRR